MEGPLLSLLVFFGLALACGYLDASMGMGYGTVLTPVLVLLGVDPRVAVSGVLLSQGFGGLAASMFHHRFRNVSFGRGSPDRRVALILASFGVVAAVLGALVSINTPVTIVRTYLGLLVLTVGALTLRRKAFAFSWRRITALGILSAFNKGLAGGGFGPVVTGGQILSGRDPKASVGVTSLVHSPICLSAFAAYLLAGHLGGDAGGIPALGSVTSVEGLHLALLAGAVAAAPVGSLATRAIVAPRFRSALGVFILTLGAWILLDTWR